MSLKDYVLRRKTNKYHNLSSTEMKTDQKVDKTWPQVCSPELHAGTPVHARHGATTSPILGGC